MKILALDSSGLTASVAIVEDDTLLGEYTICFKKTHSQTLLPMLDEVVEMIELDLNTVDGIAIASGPGSFTGLRIGSATVKGLGLALGKPLIEVPTLEALAYNLYGTEGVICPLMDARRNQTYTGVYEWDHDEFNTLVSGEAVAIEKVLEQLNEIGRPVIFLGDGVPVFREQIAKLLKVTYSFAPAHLNKQRAGAVAALGCVYMNGGRTVTAAEHQPEYLRLSQAEREREEAKRKAENDNSANEA